MEARIERMDVFQVHEIPIFREARSERETLESGRTDAEHAFRNDAGIESALGGEVALASFRPSFVLLFSHEFILASESLLELETQVP